jgi:hypothetical protein
MYAIDAWPGKSHNDADYEWRGGWAASVIYECPWGPAALGSWMAPDSDTVFSAC